MDKYITGKVTAKGVKEGCLCPIKVDGSRFRVQVPAGSWSGRVLRLQDISTKTGVHTVYVTLKVVPEKKRARWWKVLLWIVVISCVAKGVDFLINGPEETTPVRQTTTAAALQDAVSANDDLKLAMDNLYKTSMGEGAAAEAELAIIQRTSWHAVSESGPRGTMVEITAPDMEKMMNAIEQDLADGTLQAEVPDDVTREMVKRLMTSQYEERKTRLLVKTVYDENGDTRVEETEELADALYGGLFTWQKQAAAKMGVES